MGRLKAPTSRLRPMKPAVASIDLDLEGRRTRDTAKSAQPWRAWYKLARWKRSPATGAPGLRWQALLRDGCACRRCGRLDATGRTLVADHVRPHRGDPELFWDLDNLQTLCMPCHDGAKQAEERQGGV